MTLKQLSTYFRKTYGPHFSPEDLERDLAQWCEREALHQTSHGYEAYPHKDPISGWIAIDKDLRTLLVPEDGSKRLVIEGIPEKTMLFPGDVATVRPTSIHIDAAYAEFISLDKESKPQIIGTYGQARRGPGHWVDPQHPPYKFNACPIRLTDITCSPAPKHGEWVSLEVDRKHSHSWASLEGKITEVIGDPEKPGFDVQAACLRFDLPNIWPVNVDKACANLKPTVSWLSRRGRVDLTKTPLMTIDGEDAKDFDDAVYCEPLASGGWRLMVAIADVSYYVKDGSALDLEAYNRGTSVYFPGSVVPMLPEALSNELCSLKPKVDRLCMVCEMEISQAGDLKSHKFYEAVMHSHARLTYAQAQAIIDGDERAREAEPGVIEPLENLHALFKALHSQRHHRGAIDFDTVEARIYLNKQGEIIDIAATTRQTSHRIIEECMLCANVAAATFLHDNKVPALYRVHNSPPPDKLTSLRQFVGEIGLKFPARDPVPKDLAKLLESVKDRPDASMLQTVVLRSMSQAIYTTKNEGHFGLAYDAYAHFTSPIRRYPDLLVHRTLRAIIRNDKKTLGRLRKDPESVEKMALQCSMTERRAEEAARDVEKSYKCRYAEKHIGAHHVGTVVGVTHFGLFIQLDELLVDGLIHISGLGSDYYVFDPDKHQLIGESSGDVYHLGDKLDVTIQSVDIEERKIDFALMPRTGGTGDRKPKKRKKSRRK